MKELFKLLENNIAVKSLNDNKKHFVVDDTIGVALLIASSFNTFPRKYNIITTNLYNAQKMYDLLATFVGESNCLFYPVDELLRTDYITASKEMLSQRLFVMNELKKKENYILITHAAGVMKFLPSPSLFKDRILEFEVGKKYNINQIKTTLANNGYLRVNKIDHSLQFAIRGDILDIFSINHSQPIRIEFYDDEVEAIRYFDLSSQSSTTNLQQVEIVPANEMLLSNDETTDIDTKIVVRLEKDLDNNLCQNKNWLNDNVANQIEEIKNLSKADVLNKYYAFLQNAHYSILDYSCDSFTFVANKEQLLVASRLLLEEATDFLMAQAEEGSLLSHQSLFQDINPLLSKLKNVAYASELSSNETDIIFPVRVIEGSAATLIQAKELLTLYYNLADKIIISLNSSVQIDAIKNILMENEWDFEYYPELKLPERKISICLSILDEGFELLNERYVFLTAHELFRFKNKFSRYTNRYKEAVVLKSEQDLEPGDYVVHDNHGIGQFLDIKTLEVDGIHRDFLHIQYAGTDILYIPLEQFRLIRKFVGKDGLAPKLNKLGSGDWEKTKTRIKERINEMADRLFKLYSERAEITGFAFEEDDEFQTQFEAQFPFELTIDQKQSLREIKQDMESPSPMDRLLCGDVGFGKTEIAFRAAFKAILSGKQVAFLCPTTLLARQHFERATERFSAFGVKIAVFSRLIEESRQTHYMEEIARGSINLIIGTHRLLSNAIRYHDLGLLIVDEEQRFGVEQKEQIKELKTNVDVLTLTATPIPRTLQISLLGIRQLSQLNTAPTNRMPIQTYVIPQNNEVVKELIERELSRNGQVFYLHNRVSTIGEVATRLGKSIKNATIGVVHGQMDRNLIEDVMLKFYNNEINILVCTSIIETGIDISNANMIIIENADKFGLSQLYQIKGRVGRGNRIAYAYLMYKPNKNMTDVARKRLKAIQDFTELGSGYKIAQRDLLIRGAGDILGPDQAGFIDTIGMDMYIQMLNEAIEEKKTGSKYQSPKPSKTLTIDAYIPDHYIRKADKIELYQEIDDIKHLDELTHLHDKTRDIYGRIPREVEKLFMKKRISFIVENHAAFNDFNDFPEYVELILSAKLSNVDGVGVKLFNSLSPFLNEIKVVYVNKLIKIKLYKRDKWFETLEKIINTVTILFDEIDSNLTNS